MTIEFFLGFISCLLACSIVLAIAVKNLAEGVAVSGKKPFLYGSGLAVLASLITHFASFISKNPFKLFWCFGAIFLLFGIIHMMLMHHRFFYPGRHNSNRVLIAEVMFGISFILLTIIVFVALQYFFKDQDFLFFPVVVTTLLYFVPLLIFHSFQAAYEIPPAIFPTWQYPLNKFVELPDIDGGLIIGFEVAINAKDNTKDYFRVRALETWQLSVLFYHFINEYNNPDNRMRIEYIDNDGECFRWWFYKKEKWYQVRKILNPEFTIRESGIKENDVIVCERLLTSTPTSKKSNNNYYER